MDGSFVESDGVVTWSIPTKSCGAIGCEVTFFTLKAFINYINLSVCLVCLKTRMKIRERKMGWKMIFFNVLLRKENKRDRKYGGKFSLRDHLFLSS